MSHLFIGKGNTLTEDAKEEIKNRIKDMRSAEHLLLLGEGDNGKYLSLFVELSKGEDVYRVYKDADLIGTFSGDIDSAINVFEVFHEGLARVL